MYKLRDLFVSWNKKHEGNERSNTESLVIQRFLLDVRKYDDTEYRPRILYFYCMRITASLLRGKHSKYKLLDEYNHPFAVSRKVLNAPMK